jgi:hypothetical protein
LEIADEWAPPIRRARRTGPAWQRAAHLTCTLRPLSGQHAARPDSPAPTALARSPPPDRLTRAAARLADHAAVPTNSSSKPPWSKATDAVRRRAAHRSPVDVASRRRPRAGEPPVPRPSPVRRCRAAVGSLSSAAAVQGRRAPRVARGGRAGPRQRGEHGMRPAWPRAAPTLCDWAEHGFGPVAPGLIFIFSDLFNSLQIQKFV